MYIKYHGFKCECGEIVSPPFNELHFDMREGEILENGSGELICEKCGAIYELEDMEFSPIFVRTDKKDENGLYFIRIRSKENATLNNKKEVLMMHRGIDSIKKALFNAIPLLICEISSCPVNYKCKHKESAGRWPYPCYKKPLVPVMCWKKYLEEIDLWKDKTWMNALK